MRISDWSSDVCSSDLSDGRYNIVPADTAMATGAVAPRTGSPVNARGFESRVVQLQYISAAEMEKILKPYARPNSIVNVDSGRNVITVAGSRTGLENYLRTIRIFDVDWLSSMSLGVFPLQSGKASKDRKRAVQGKRGSGRGDVGG